MTCQFCGQELSGTRTKTCAKRECLLAATSARARARREVAPPPVRKKKSDGRTIEFPPELEYLNQDPGITVEQMQRARTDPTLRLEVLRSRAARQARLSTRLKIIVQARGSSYNNVY